MSSSTDSGILPRHARPCRSKNKGCLSCPEGRRTAFQGGASQAQLAGCESRLWLSGFLQFLRGAERDLLAGLDLDRLAGGRIAAHARGALAHLQDAEAADADAVALLEVLDDEVDHVVEDRFGGLLGELMLLGEVRRDVLQGESRGSCFRCHGSLSPWFERVYDGINLSPSHKRFSQL